MSLVAYDSSDESDNCDDSESTLSEITGNKANIPQCAITLPTEFVSSKKLQISLPPPKVAVSNDDQVVDDKALKKSQEETDNERNTNSLFLSLPAPKRKDSLDVIEEDLDAIPITNNSIISLPKKKPSKQVKITIPALSELDDDEYQPATKHMKRSSSPLGLLSMLPAPRNLSIKEASRQLIPQVLTKKSEVKPHTITKKIIPQPKKSANSAAATVSTKAPKKLIAYGSDNEEDNEETGNDYFSLDKEDIKPDSLISRINVTVPVKQEINQSNATYTNCPLQFAQPQSNSIYENTLNDSPLAFIPGWTIERKDQSTISCSSKYQPPVSSASMPDISSNPVQDSSSFLNKESESALNIDEALLHLQGKRRRKEEIKIIDVKADVYDVSSSFNKSLTEEVVQRPSRKKGEMPTRQQKSKHQITYLAFQAKERELLLKNEWSNNKMTKRQTQSKYGF